MRYAYDLPPRPGAFLLDSDSLPSPSGKQRQRAAKCVPGLLGRIAAPGTLPFGLVEQPAPGEFLGLVFIKVEQSRHRRTNIVSSGYCEDGHQGNESYCKAYKDPFHDPQYQGAGSMSLSNIETTAQFFEVPEFRLSGLFRG